MTPLLHAELEVRRAPEVHEVLEVVEGLRGGALVLGPDLHALGRDVDEMLPVGQRGVQRDRYAAVRRGALCDANARLLRCKHVVGEVARGDKQHLACAFGNGHDRTVSKRELVRQLRKRFVANALFVYGLKSLAESVVLLGNGGCGKCCRERGDDRQEYSWFHVVYYIITRPNVRVVIHVDRSRQLWALAEPDHRAAAADPQRTAARDVFWNRR